MVCQEEDYIILTDYISLREYQQLQDMNVRLVVNLSANSCYNYFLNDIEYKWFYLTPLPSKQPNDAVLFENNIENIVLPLTHAIIKHTDSNKQNKSMNSHVVVHSSGALFSDENVAAVIGYLIVRYLYTF